MTSLPLWLQVIAFIGGIAGILSTIYQLWFAFIGAKVNLRLTNDFFFRIIDMGECLFIRSVLIAEHENALITNIQAYLSRINPENTKKWELEFLKFGEVLSDNKNVEPSFSFQSSSPFKFLAKGLPVQAVYLARPKSYANEYSEIIKNFHQSVQLIKNKVSKNINNQDQNKDSQAFVNDILAETRKLSDQFADQLYDKVQLEHGRYQIDLIMTYKSIKGVSSYFNRHVRASIYSFEIENNAREMIKLALPDAVFNSALNSIFNINNNIIYPEIRPIQITEDDAV